MKKDEARLGKGLGAIFGEDLSNVIEEIQQGDESRQSEIKLSEIRPNPYQPRKIFDDEKIGELAQSIKEHGVFTPVLLRKSVKGYELIAGERRVRASKKAGLKTIPAIVMEFTEEQMMEISLLENIQREDLNAIEEAQAYQRLIERLDYTQEKLAQRVGIPGPRLADVAGTLMVIILISPSIQTSFFLFYHSRRRTSTLKKRGRLKSGLFQRKINPLHPACSCVPRSLSAQYCPAHPHTDQTSAQSYHAHASCCADRLRI